MFGLYRLIDEHGIDLPTARVALRSARLPSVADLFAVIEIAMLAEGVIRPVQDLINIKYLYYIDKKDNLYYFDKSKAKKYRPCTAAGILADEVEGNSDRSKMERLRRKFRKHEKYYRFLARNWAIAIELALKWPQFPGNWSSEEERTSVEHEISAALRDPLMSLYVSRVTLPEISALRKELRAQARDLDKERDALVQRREELEIIQRWHALAHWEGLPVSQGTGKKQLQEAIDGINALRNSIVMA
jgi:hypothetical protein